MSCQSIWADIPLATEFLTDEVYKIASHNEIWMNIVPNGVFDKGRGLVHTAFTSPRQEPTIDDETWPDITLFNGEGSGFCNKTYDTLTYGYDAFTYRPQSKDWKGPVICADELGFYHNVEEFLADLVQREANQARRKIGNRLAKLYRSFARKAVCTATGIEISEPGVNTGLPVPESELTQSRLDEIAIQLAWDNADTFLDSNKMVAIGSQGGLYSLLLGFAIGQNLLRNNSDMRADLRWAFSGKASEAPLLYRMGARYSLQNYIHIPDKFPPRYTWQDGVFTRVNTWEKVAATKGTKVRLTAAYKTAPYESATILTDACYKNLIVQPSNGIGSTKFNPDNWAGQPTWVTGAYKWSDCEDPKERQGRHYWSYANAGRKMHPEVAYEIFYLRCDLHHSQVGCS